MGTIVSAFPATGKSWVFNTDKSKVILDSDSSQFSWVEDSEGQVRNPNFPGNYIQHIRQEINNCDIMFVSSHRMVRDALLHAGIPYYLVYPERNLGLRIEYLKRCKNRGTPEIAELLNHNWDTFMHELEAQTGCEHIRLGQGQYLSDVMNLIPAMDGRELERKGS